MSINYSTSVGVGSRLVIKTPGKLNYSLPFCLLEIGQFYANKDYDTLRVQKEGFYLVYTWSGKGILKCDGDEEILDSQYAVLIDGKHTHQLRSASGEPWVHYWIHFCGSSADVFQECILSDGGYGIYIDQSELFEQCFDELFQYAQKHDVQNSVAISMTIHRLLSIMIEDRFSEKNGRKFVLHQGDIRRVVDYIQENYNQQISLDDLIEVVHLSKYYFLKLFKQHTGLSPYEYLIHFRINKAKMLLRSTDRSVGSIAAEVGFLDESNFIKQFKKITGSKPLVYRKQPW